MATMYKRSNGIYYAKYQDNGKMVCVSLRTSSKKDALRAKTELERAVLLGRASKSAVVPLTFADAWTAYEAGVKVAKKATVLYNESCVWRTWSDWCSAHNIPSLQAVRTADVAAWQSDRLAAGHAAVGVNTYQRILHAVWNHLIRLEVLGVANPFQKVQPVPTDRTTKFLPWADVKKMVAAAGTVGRDIHLVFILGAYAGLRKDEILRTKWKHVDWEARKLFADGTKTAASSDSIPLHKDLRLALEQYREEKGFIVAPDHTAASTHSYRWDWRRQWAKVEKLSGLEATPHQLRHSVATHLLDLGYNIQHVAKFLRHANDVPTRRYADLKGVTLEMDRF